MREPLEFITIQNNKIVPCEMEGECKNSPSNCLQPRCNECRLSPGIVVGNVVSLWSPINKKIKHPILEEERKEEKRNRVLSLRTARHNKDKDRQARLKKAKNAEKKTEKKIIKSTRNSGRINKDADHLVGNGLLDTKLQSNRLDPVVRLFELDKVREDARRNNRLFGGLAIHNMYGRVVVVIDQSDFSKICLSE